MKVLLVGLPYFSKFIAKKLQDNFPKHKFIHLNTYYSNKDKIRYLFHIFSADVVYSINGSTSKSSVINLALWLKKRIIFHWVGSDLMLAKEAYKSNSINPNYIQNVTHITDTPWFVGELANIGINARFVPLSVYSAQFNLKISLPSSFSVLSYVKEGNEEFYGFQTIIEIAKMRPDIRFQIAGMKNYIAALPSNIQLLGWVTDMAKVIQENVICMRTPLHDGLSFFVIESLALGRYVIYNQKYEPSIFAESTSEIISQIDRIKDLYDKNELDVNHQAVKFVQSNFNETKVLLDLFKTLNRN